MTPPRPDPSLSGWLWLWEYLAERLGADEAAALKAAYRDQQCRHEEDIARLRGKITKDEEAGL